MTLELIIKALEDFRGSTAESVCADLVCRGLNTAAQSGTAASRLLLGRETMAAGMVLMCDGLMSIDQARSHVDQGMLEMMAALTLIQSHSAGKGACN
jgi:hypothetical protein